MVPPTYLLLYVAILVANFLSDIAASYSLTRLGPDPRSFIKTKNDALRILFPIEEYLGTCDKNSLFTSPAYSSSTIPGLLTTMQPLKQRNDNLKESPSLLNRHACMVLKSLHIPSVISPCRRLTQHSGASMVARKRVRIRDDLRTQINLCKILRKAFFPTISLAIALAGLTKLFSLITSFIKSYLSKSRLRRVVVLTPTKVSSLRRGSSVSDGNNLRVQGKEHGNENHHEGNTDIPFQSRENSEQEAWLIAKLNEAENQLQQDEELRAIRHARHINCIAREANMMRKYDPMRSAYDRMLDDQRKDEKHRDLIEKVYNEEEKDSKDPVYQIETAWRRTSGDTETSSQQLRYWIAKQWYGVDYRFL